MLMKTNTPSPKKTRRKALDILFHQLANMSDLNPYIAKAKRKTKIIKNVPYRQGGHPDHTLDVYIPKNRSGLLPVVIYIHGGGFVLGSKTTHRGCALLYARSGCIVFNINYRRAPKHRYPAALSDACHAYQWVVQNAASYGGDVNRIILSGESAGGNLSLGLLVAACYRRPETYARMVWQTNIVPAAVSCIAGLLQVSNPQRFSKQPQGKKGLVAEFSVKTARDVAKAYLGRKISHHDATRALADPLVIIEKAGKAHRPLPPVFAAVGTADLVCNDTERLAKALQPHNSEIAVRFYPHEPHVFHFMFWKKNAHRFWRDHLTFLQQHISIHRISPP